MLFVHFLYIPYNVITVIWLILLPPEVGWYIMGYESEPPPSYPKLRNCSYYLKLITPHPCLLISFIYHVLIPPMHQPGRPQHPLHLCAKCIDRAAGHPLRYFCLTPIHVHPYGVEPRIFHRLL